MSDYRNDYSYLRRKAMLARMYEKDSNHYRYFVNACDPNTIINLIDELTELQEKENERV